MAAISSIHSGISEEEKLFWRNFSVNELHSLYLSLSATVEKVSNIIEEPVESNCKSFILSTVHWKYEK